MLAFRSIIAGLLGRFGFGLSHPNSTPFRVATSIYFGQAWDVAKNSWAIFQQAANPTHCLNGMNGRTVFVPNEIEDSDWRQILNDLGTAPDTLPQPEEPIRKKLIDLL
jgi:hypothetical protein